MYSMVLFMVDRSLSGFFGSGDNPTSAVERTLLDEVVGGSTGELDVVVQIELVLAARPGRRGSHRRR